MTALARQSVALELAFYGLLRAAHVSVARFENDLKKASNDIDKAALSAAIRQVRAAIAAAEAVR